MSGAGAPAPWVELRVHGVSGTPPEELLDRPHVTQVDGDARSRFFRATDADHQLLVDARDGHVIEGFHWGLYTSGSWKQAFWIALLPFGLVNLAAFMLPGPRVGAGGVEERRGVARRRLALALLRVLGLLLTMMLSLGLAQTLMDVVSARWLPRQEWAASWIVSAAPTIATLFVGILVTWLGGASWLASRLGLRDVDQSAQSDQPLSATPRAAGVNVSPNVVPNDAYMTPFASDEFYRGDPETTTLRGLHVAAALVIPALIALSVSEHGARFLAMAVTVGLLLVALLLGDREGAASTGLEEPIVWLRRTFGWVVGSAVLVGAVLLVIGALSVHDLGRVTAAESTDALPHRGLEWNANQYNWFSELVLYTSFGTLLALAVVVVLLSRATRPMGLRDDPWAYFRAYTARCAAIPVAALGLFLGVGFTSAFLAATSTTLNGGSPRLSDSATTDILQSVAYAWGIGVLPVVVMGAVLLWFRVRSGRALRQKALTAYPAPSPFPSARVSAWRKSLVSAIWAARVKNAVPVLVWTLVSSAALLSLAMVVSMATGLDLWPLTLHPDSPDAWNRAWMAVGTWVLFGMATGMVALARGALRDSNLRRAANIIWDVVAFWPHAVHPFIPTPYSLRVVGDLAQRIRDHLAATPAGVGRSVVVCAHSQGSLITFAALNLLTDEEIKRVGLVTFGSQLRVIFPRAFPLYVNFAAIERTYQRLDGAWINLYRDTDPLAGPVLSWHHTENGLSEHFPGPYAGLRPVTIVGRHGTVRHGNDWRLVDPVPRVQPLQRAPVNALHGHGNYWASPDWARALAAVRA